MTTTVEHLLRGIEKAGRGAALARALKQRSGKPISPGNVNDWLHRRRPCPLHIAANLAEYLNLPASAGVLAAAQDKLGKAIACLLAGAVATLFSGATADAQAAGVGGLMPAHDNV